MGGKPKKAIAVAHDPGGANAVAITVAALRQLGWVVDAYAKGPAIRQFQRLAVPCRPVPCDYRGVIPQLEGELLLAGTSQHDRFELDCISWAASVGIPSVGMIDYWANYRTRFLPVDPRQAEPVFPDLITAIDEDCAAEMVADGIPAGRIRVVGQPYFAWLVARQQPRVCRPGPVRNILFASQPEANEIEVLHTVAEVLAGHKHLERLLIRFHPRQADRDPSLELLIRSGLPFAVDDSTDVLATLAQQDLVLGISSVILIEAALMGVPAGSLTIGTPDTLMTNQWGLTARLTSAAELRAFLDSEAGGEAGRYFIEWQRGASERITQLCLDLVSPQHS